MSVRNTTEMSENTFPYEEKFRIAIEIFEPTDVLLSPTYMVLIIALFIASGFKKLLVRSHYTYLLMIALGIVIGISVSWFPVGSSLNTLHITPPVIAVIFWPSILLGKGIKLNVHMLQKSWLQILMMSTAIYTCQINIVGYLAFKAEIEDYYKEYADKDLKSVCTIFLIGAITTTIDAQLLADVKNTQSSGKALISVIEGEALASLVLTFMTLRVIEQFNQQTISIFEERVLGVISAIHCTIFTSKIFENRLREWFMQAGTTIWNKTKKSQV